MVDIIENLRQGSPDKGLFKIFHKSYQNKHVRPDMGTHNIEKVLPIK